MGSSTSQPNPVQQTAITTIKEYHLSDLSLSLSNFIAVSGYDGEGKTFIKVLHVNGTAYYSEEFKKDKKNLFYWRYVSFMDTSSENIVTCFVDTIQLINITEKITLKVRKLEGSTTVCLNVKEGKIFVGLNRSNGTSVIVLDNDLKTKKTILNEIINFKRLTDITVSEDRLFLCHADGATSYLESLPSALGCLTCYNSDSPSYLTSLKIWWGRMRYENDLLPFSITASENLGLVVVARYGYEVAFYPFNEEEPFSRVHLDSNVQRIGISEKCLMMVTVNYDGEVKKFYLKVILTSHHMKKYLVSKLSPKECRQLVYHLQIRGKDSENILKSDNTAERLLSSLEEGGIIHLPNISRLAGALRKINLYHYSVVHIYQQIYASTEDRDHPERERISKRVTQEEGNASTISSPSSPPDGVMSASSNDYTNQPRKSEDIQGTTTEESEMYICFEYLSEQVCGEVSKLGTHLGLSQAQIGHIKNDNKDNSRSVSYQIFIKWKQINGSKATYPKLADALEKAERTDLAEKVSRWSM